MRIRHAAALLIAIAAAACAPHAAHPLSPTAPHAAPIAAPTAHEKYGIGPVGGGIGPQGGGSSGGGLSSVSITGAGLSGAGTVGTPLQNTGVTSAVSGTGVSVSGATGAVTFTANLPGGTCANGQVPTVLAANGTLTCAQPTVDYVDGFTEFDDFVNSVSGKLFTLTVSGTGAACSTTGTPAITHPGILDVALGTTSTGRCSGWTSAGTALIAGGGQLVIEALAQIPVLSNSTDGFAFQIGGGDTVNAVGQTDGCYWEYDERNAAGHNASNVQKWIAVCAKAGTRTAYIADGSTEGAGDGSFVTVNQPVAAGSLPDTNWYKLKLVFAADGSQVDFYVNDVKSAQIKTNIPNTTSNGFQPGWLGLKSVGTTATHILMDWYRLRQSLTTPRS